MNGAVPGTSSLPCPFPGHSGAKSVRKYPKSAENETNNDHTGQEVFKIGEYSRDVCQVYSGGKRVQKRELWLYSTAYLPML